MPKTASPPTIARALGEVAGWTDLTPARRRDLASYLNSTARCVGMPAGTVQLTPAVLRKSFLQQSAANYGLTIKSMKNIRSGLRFILRRLNLLDSVDAPLSEAWAVLLGQLDIRKRAEMIAFARFCSERQIAPDHVSSLTFEGFFARLTERTLSPNPRKRIGSLRSFWNRASGQIKGWPATRIEQPQGKTDYVLPLDAFPETFQSDLAAFGERLSATLLDGPFTDMPESALDNGGLPFPSKPPRPLRPSTVALRQSHIRWAASALVETGVPVEELTSLASLVTPVDRARDILRFLYNRRERGRSAASTHVAEVLRMIARYYVGLPEAKLVNIQKWSLPGRLEYRGMTAKNETFVREMMAPERMEKYLQLPEALMRKARALLSVSPVQAAGVALRALAIRILSRIPLRLANLCGLRLGQHLQRDDPKRSRVSYILILAHETKNAREIRMPVSNKVADLLEEWTLKFRPALASDDCVFLFPGHGTGNRPMTPQGLRDAIKSTMKQYVGTPLSPHAFRHLSARIFLREFPGHYEEVRQLLGHASVVTTARHYSGIEAESAAIRYDELLDRPRRR